MATVEGHWRTLARQVRQRRRELGIPTQEAAAEKAAISKNTWQRLENGKSVSMGSLAAVAEALHWSPAYPIAIVERGEEAVVAGEINANLPAMQGGSTARVSATPTGGEGETVIARPATVQAAASIPGPAVRQAPASVTSAPSVVPLTPEVSVLLVPIPLIGEDAKELDEDDTSWVSHQVKMYGLDMIAAIARTKRAQQGR